MTDFKNFSVAAIFSDHMVLQRNKYVAIFGGGAAGALVRAQLFDANGAKICENSTIAENGRWILRLEPQEAQTGCKLVITWR